jgi:hypothetical protein
LASPVYDGATGTVFVGSYNGKLYGFYTSGGNAGTQITGSPLTLATGDDSSDGLLEAPPIVDSTNHVLYEFLGSNAITTLAGCTSAGSCAEVAQVAFTGTPTFSSSTTSALTTAGTNLAALLTTFGGTFPIPDGAFSQSYYNGFSSSSSFLYLCGAYTSGSPTFSLLQFNFNSSRILQTTVNAVDTRSFSSYSGNHPFCSPFTEFYNTNGTATDWLFFTTVGSSADIYSYTITGNTLGGGIAFSHSVGSTLGASAIIVDGADPTSNASSVYGGSGVGSCIAVSTASPANNGIGTTGAPAICAYKYTQNGLE